MQMNFFGKYFKILLVSFFFVELISLLGYLFPLVNIISFFVLLGAVLILSLIKLEYGLYAILAELLIGSKGYLFFFDYNGTIISLRIALFLAVMTVWFLRFLQSKKIRFKNSPFFGYFIALFAIIFLSALHGFWKNGFSDTFFDLNAWFYFALIFPFYDALTSKEKINNLLQIFTAGVTALSIKTFFLLYIFSHNLWQISYSVYRWVRNTGVGEITSLTPSFSRIFIQSQVFSLVAIFIFLCLLVYSLHGFYKQHQNKFLIKAVQNKYVGRMLILIVLYISVCFISFSRSFWAGGFLTSLVMVFIWFYIFKHRFGFILQSSIFFIVVSAISVGLVYGVANFPYPQIEDGFFSAGMISERAKTVSGEAGASSRWNLLPELWNEIKKNPILGAGFGKTVTYQSADPRILEQDPEGMYTTYAFEWGYLDIWLKMGLVGLFLYVSLLGKIWQKGWRLLYEYKDKKEEFLLWGILLGLVVVATTSIFSPYLNHPLGIGYIIFSAIIINLLSKKQQQAQVIEKQNQ